MVSIYQVRSLRGLTRLDDASKSALVLPESFPTTFLVECVFTTRAKIKQVLFAVNEAHRCLFGRLETFSSSFPTAAALRTAMDRTADDEEAHSVAPPRTADMGEIKSALELSFRRRLPTGEQNQCRVVKDRSMRRFKATSWNLLTFPEDVSAASACDQHMMKPGNATSKLHADEPESCIW